MTYVKLEAFLRLIYLSNIALLTFVAPSAYFLPKDFEHSDKVNQFVLLAGSYWLAILICSVIGLLYPFYMEPIIIVQITYKALYTIQYFIHINETKTRPHGVMVICFSIWIILISAYFITKLVFYLTKKSN